MNVNFEKLGNVSGEITVTLEEKDYADKVKKQLKEIGKKHAEPGFRPGHVPAGLIAKKYGTAVKYDVVNKEVADAVFNYIKENNIQVLGQPVPESDNKFDIANADFTFKFKVGIAPEIDTHVNKDMHVPYYTIEVSEEMVNEQMEAGMGSDQELMQYFTIKDFSIKLALTFNEDDTYKLAVDEAAMGQSLDNIMMSSLGEMESSGTFQAKGGMIYMTDGDGTGVEPYELEDSTLTLTGEGVDDGELVGLYPMTFTKK